MMLDTGLKFPSRVPYTRPESQGHALKIFMLQVNTAYLQTL